MVEKRPRSIGTEPNRCQLERLFNSRERVSNLTSERLKSGNITTAAAYSLIVRNLSDSSQKVVDGIRAGCIIRDVAGGADAQTSASRKTPSNSKLIVPASASSAADRAPRSRYLRAGTAIFKAIRLNPRLNQPSPATARSRHSLPRPSQLRRSSKAPGRPSPLARQ